MHDPVRGDVRPFGSRAEVAALVHEVERCRLELSQWDHRAHLAVAMWYLTHHAEQEAYDLVIQGIQRFNGVKGIRHTDVPDAT